MGNNMNKIELPHYRFADASEERRHELRERVRYYVDFEQHDLLTGLSARHGTTVEMPAFVLVALLDELDKKDG